MKKRFQWQLLSMIIVLALVFSQAPSLSLIQIGKAAATENVSDWNQLKTALKDSSCTTINLNADIKTDRTANDDPLVIGHPGKTVTINGNGRELSLNEGGIVLGGNVTLDNIYVTFISQTRNAFVANGHHLTLNNVKNKKAAAPLNVFAGEVHGFKGTGGAIPASGNNAQVTISGVSQIGQVFAGSLSEGNGDADSPANTYSKPVTITVNLDSGSSIGEVYAHGGREPRDGSNPGGMVANPDKYKVSGEVSIKTNGTVIRKIFGKTGGTKDAKLVYNDTKGYPNTSLVITDISGISVESGKLTPAGTSTLSPNADISVAKDCHIGLTNYSNPTINNFNGAGGYLILGASQKLTINGNVTGSAKLAVGGIFGDKSEKEPTIDYTYITAPNSKDGDFTLLHKDDKNKTLQKIGNDWIVKQGSGSQDKTELTAFDITDKKVTVKKSEYKLGVASFAVNPTFKSGTGYLSDIKMTYSVGFGSQRYPGTTNEDGTGEAPVKSLNMKFIQDGDENDASLWVEPIDQNKDNEIYVGTYTIDVTVPISGSTPVTRQITLEITDDSTPTPPTHTHKWDYKASGAVITATCSGQGVCDVPSKTATLTLTAPKDLKFNGNPKEVTIVGEIPNVAKPTVTYENGSAPTDAGTYKASMTLGGQKAELSFTVTKADPVKLAQIDSTIKASDKTISIGNLGKGMPANAKDLTYKVGTPTVSGAKKTQVSGQKADNGTLTANITNGTGGETITFPITITSKNYSDSTVNVVVTLTDKEILTIDIKAVSGQNGSYDGVTQHTGYTGTPKVDGDKVPVSELEKVYIGKLADNSTIYNQVNKAPTEAGTYTVTFKVADSNKQYTGQSGTISFTISPKQLAWKADSLSGTKVYDGNTNAPEIKGNIGVSGILDADAKDAAFSYKSISASALSSADVGDYKVELALTEAKLTGKKAHNYTLPTSKLEVSVKVTKAKGTAAVSISNWTVGGSVPTPVLKTTNTGAKVTYQYKGKDEPETSYKDFANPPTVAGVYVLKASVEPTKNYTEVIATTEFSIIDPALQVEIKAIVIPENSGRVEGAGIVNKGSQVTVKAIANEGFQFKCWQEDGIEIAGANAEYSFLADKDRALMAVFEQKATPPAEDKQHNITLKVEPAEAGTVKGAGQYKDQANVTVSATANEGYKFLHWKENGLPVNSAGAVYSFTAIRNRDLVAVFEKNDTPSAQTSKIEKNELIAVPSTITKYKTVEELKEAMMKVSIEQGGYTKDKTKFFDIKLKLTNDNGNTWIDATESNYPTEGITVEFMYKDMGEGVGKNTHDFHVTHMYTINSDRLGTIAGDIETPYVTKLEDRIRVTLNGLSPVSVSWKPINQGITGTTNEPTNNTTGTTVNNGTNGQANTNGTTVNGENTQDSPKTSDKSYMLYGILAMLLSGMVAATGIYIKNKNHQ